MRWLLNEIEQRTAKALLLDEICDTCFHNGLNSRVNYMQLPECHYWYNTNRSHPFAINPPLLPEEKTCDNWKEKNKKK